MRDELEEIRVKATNPQTRNEARGLAAAYVENFRAEFEELEDKSIEKCVKAVDAYRSAEMLESQWRVEVWIMYKWEPQTIGGLLGPVLTPAAQSEGEN